LRASPPRDGNPAGPRRAQRGRRIDGVEATATIEWKAKERIQWMSRGIQ
jgi:hypothetical protein